MQEFITWRSISMRAGPAFLQFDWSKDGLSMNLPVLVYSHTKTQSLTFFKDREDVEQEARNAYKCYFLHLCLFPNVSQKIRY